MRPCRDCAVDVAGGGNDNPGIPSADDEDILVSAILAQANGVMCATLYQIPNAPIVFAADPTHSGRGEDSLISYSWHMYWTDYDPTWNVLFPMAKGAVRAMDTITAFAKKQFGYDTNQFLVAGGSKRGWTTWLAAAVDPRIVAIAPIVMDMLNFEANVRHMYQAYGGWTFAFQVCGRQPDLPSRCALMLCAVCCLLCSGLLGEQHHACAGHEPNRHRQAVPDH